MKRIFLSMILSCIVYCTKIQYNQQTSLPDDDTSYYIFSQTKQESTPAAAPVQTPAPAQSPAVPVGATAVPPPTAPAPSVAPAPGVAPAPAPGVAAAPGEAITPASGVSAPVAPAQEKDILLVVPFTKEQFEAEMALQQKKLSKQAKFNHDEAVKELKSIAENNRQIIQQKARLIQLYLNTTRTYLDNFTKVLSRELEQNHRLMVALAQAIVLTQNSFVEKQIIDIKDKIQKILYKVQPPKSLCDQGIHCEDCIIDQDCVWSPDRRSCFVGSKYDGCYFDECQFFLKDNCNVNSIKYKGSKEEMDSYLFDEEFKKEVLIKYPESSVELSNQRIPQPQKDYLFEQQNKMIELKDEMQRQRMLSNYLKKIYYKLRFQNVMLRRKLLKQAEEDKKFLEELAKSDQSFLDTIKESEEDKLVTIDALVKTDKMEEQSRKEQLQELNQPKQVISSSGEIIAKTKVNEDGTILDDQGEPIEGIKIINKTTIINEEDQTPRKDFKFKGGYVVDEKGNPVTIEQIKNKLASEGGFTNALLNSWYGSEDEEKDVKKKDLDLVSKERLARHKEEMPLDMDSSDIEDEEQSILQYIADSIAKQNKQQGK